MPYHPPGEPDYAGFLPYLPVMAVAGIPSDIWPNSGLSDARIFFCLTTLAVAAVAMYLCRSPGRRKIRAVQALIILPLAALPLATGGDDIPVVAFMLLAMVLAQRQRPFASGVVLGIASAMKFTAWPLAVLALFCAWDRRGRRRPLVMLAGILVVAVPTIFPFALRGPFALIDDVVLFPLGLSAIPSTAASALPGHVLVTWFPSLSRALPLGVGLILGVGLLRHLTKHTPRTVAEVCTISGVVMAVLILLAPNPRVGYLVYPVNLFVWAYLLAEPDGGAANVARLLEPLTSWPPPAGPDRPGRSRSERTGSPLFGVGLLEQAHGEGRVARGRRTLAERGRLDGHAHLPVVAVGPGQLPEHLERRWGRWRRAHGRRPASPGSSCRTRRRPAAPPARRRSAEKPASRTAPTRPRCSGSRAGPRPPGCPPR